MSAARQIYVPHPVAVKVDCRGAPRAIGDTAVEAIREEWVVEDRWWSESPLHRHYHELVLANGRSTTVFRDVRTGRWYRQPA